MAFLDDTGLTRLWMHIVARLGKKVDTVEGKGLSTNDFTTEEKEKLAGLANYELPTAGATLGGVRTTSTVSSTNGLTATPIINGVPYYKASSVSLEDFAVNGETTFVNRIKLEDTVDFMTQADYANLSIYGVTEDGSSHLVSKLYYEPSTTGINGGLMLNCINTETGETVEHGIWAHEDYVSIDSLLLTTPLSIVSGGTGASTQQEALTNLGAAPLGHTHDSYLAVDGGTITGDLTVNGTLTLNSIIPLANGGTGANTRAGAIKSLTVPDGIITNADNYLDIGFYTTNEQTTSLPYATYGILSTYKPSQEWIVQTWTSVDKAKGELYMRKNINGEGFGNWFKVMTEDNIIYSTTQPTSASAGAIWLKPIQ